MKKRILFVLLSVVFFSGVSWGQTLFDSFSDGNFTASPVWGGNTSYWTVVTSSDAAAGATNSYTLRLSGPATAETDYLSSQVSTWGQTQEWDFFVGRRGQAFSAANQQYFWLYANEATLNNATVDGYRIAIGDDAGGDDIRLEYVVNGALSSTVITSSGAIVNGLTDIGFLVRVTRSASGVWTLYTSTLPIANSTGAIASDVPNSTNCSVNQGSATNNTLVPAANGYIGVAALHSTGASAIITAEFDQIYFTASSTPPTLSAASGATVDNAFNVTLTADDATWRSAITSITVDGTTLTAGFDKTQTGKIVFTPSASAPASLLQTSSATAKTIVFKATGYTDASVSQTISAGVASSSTSTATINSALSLNATSTVTATAKDQYSNLVSGYSFKVLPTITNTSATTAESYTVNGTSYTSTPVSAATFVNATNSSGVATFMVVVPAAVDGGDGVSVQVKMNDGTTNVGSPFSYTAPTLPAVAISSSGLSESTLNGAQVSLALSNTAFTDGTLSSANFTLNNAPTGTSVNSVTYNTSTSATITLTFNGTDFDANVSTFSITVAGSELTSGSAVTSNTLTISAITETTPTVTTTAISGATSIAASSGGDISSDGGGTASAAVTARGVCWSTTLGAETASGSHTSDGTGTGSFTSTLSGLSPNTIYYVKAYATNSVGTSYGSEVSFTTNVLSAPTANYATNFSTTGFTANWAAAIGATNYQLDVSTSTAFSTGGSGTLTEGFAGGATAPTDWTFTSIGGTYTTSGNYGAASPSLKMDATGDMIQTPLLSGAATQFSFWIKGQGTDAASALLVEGYNGTSWVIVQNITSSIPITGTTYSYSSSTTPALPSNLVQFKFTYTKSGGNLSFDDVSITYSSASTMVSGYSNLTVNGTSQSVTNLSANTKYYYRVRAYSSSSTSANSSTISLTTPNVASVPAVTTGTDIPVTVSGSTGISTITFGSVSTGGNLSVSRFSDAPANSTGITNTNTSWYRWIIEPPAGFAFTNYTLKFKRTDINGISVSSAQQIPAEGDNTSVILYKRSTPGSGAFENVGALTYHQNSTPLDMSDD